jgi:hypothetical protein
MPVGHKIATDKSILHHLQISPIQPMQCAIDLNSAIKDPPITGHPANSRYTYRTTACLDPSQTLAISALKLDVTSLVVAH